MQRLDLKRTSDLYISLNGIMNSKKNQFHSLTLYKIYYKDSKSDYNFNFMQTLLFLPLLIITLVHHTYELEIS